LPITTGDAGGQLSSSSMSSSFSERCSPAVVTPTQPSASTPPPPRSANVHFTRHYYVWTQTTQRLRYQAHGERERRGKFPRSRDVWGPAVAQKYNSVQLCKTLLVSNRNGMMKNTAESAILRSKIPKFSGERAPSSDNPIKGQTRMFSPGPAVVLDWLEHDGVIQKMIPFSATSL